MLKVALMVALFSIAASAVGIPPTIRVWRNVAGHEGHGDQKVWNVFKFLEAKLPERQLESFRRAAPKLKEYELVRVGPERIEELQKWILERLSDDMPSKDQDPVKFWRQFFKELDAVSGQAGV